MHGPIFALGVASRKSRHDIFLFFPPQLDIGPPHCPILLIAPLCTHAPSPKIYPKVRDGDGDDCVTLAVRREVWWTATTANWGCWAVVRLLANNGHMALTVPEEHQPTSVGDWAICCGMNVGVLSTGRGGLWL